MTLLMCSSAEKYRAWTEILAERADRCASLIAQRLETGGPSAAARYLEYLRWPSRQMEYSFVLRSLEKYRDSGSLASILDVGSGPSPLPAILASAFPCRVISVDRDRELVHAMQSLRLPNCSYEGSDMARLPFHNDSFDVVICVSVLEHAPRPQGLQAIREMLRVVREDGVVIVTVDYRSLDGGPRLAKVIRGIGKAVRLLFFRQGRTLFNSLSAPRPYTWRDLKEISSHFKACIIGEPEKSWARLHLRDIRAFWRDHWEPGFHYDRRWGRDYTSVGLILSRNSDVRCSLASLALAHTRGAT